tara:strand:+ start:192 stop:476 length:285 start_codon:yes stop_codon:yes gene_type:complete
MEYMTIISDGNEVSVESEIDSERGEVTIRFGMSYTLRLDSRSLIALEDLFYSAKRDLAWAKTLIENPPVTPENMSDEELDDYDNVLDRLNKSLA